MDCINVSIITVSYNSEKTIKRTIQSVLNQTYQNIEYILVDGLSSDGTVEIIKSYQKKFNDKNINYLFVSEKDRGIYDAMNKGIQMASGDIIGIINSDDWYEINAVERMVDVYRKNKFDMFYADTRVINGNKSSIKHCSPLKGIISTRCWSHTTTFITCDVYKKYKYKLESIYDDWDLVLRIKNAGYKIVVLNEVLANFRVGGVSNRSGIFSLIQRICVRYKIYINNDYCYLYIFECIGMELMKQLYALIHIYNEFMKSLKS